jgi:hypothetical protein
MTQDAFMQFIADHDLYSFDGLIEITLTGGVTHRAVWITTIPELKPAVDGDFAGIPDAECFYLLDKKEYLMLDVKSIESVKCVQEGYLK